ncbi:MAG: hypothetical protein ACRYFS_20025, partial [Janthinobacterium lividum]
VYTVPCQIVLPSAPAQAQTYTLSNSNPGATGGLVSFGLKSDGSDAASTLSIVIDPNTKVPGNTSTTSAFYISGKQLSLAVNDDSIKVQQSANSTPVSQPVTVFSFNQAQMVFDGIGGQYGVQTTEYEAGGSYAISFKCIASVTPSGLDETAPQLKSLKTGFIQNVMSCNDISSWSSPMAPSWQTKQSLSVTVYNTITFTTQFTGQYNDGVAKGASLPLYDEPAFKSYPYSTEPVGTYTQAEDNPGVFFPTSFTTYVGTSAVPQAALVTYMKAAKAIVNNSFTIWCVIFHDSTQSEFNSSPRECTPLAQNTWSVNADSTMPPVTASKGDQTDVKLAPTVIGPVAGDYGATVTTTKFGGTGTIYTQ